MFVLLLGKRELVAQLVEQYTFNVWVLGSSPSQFTKKNPAMDSFLFYKVAKSFYDMGAQLAEHPDCNREGPEFESQPVHKNECSYDVLRF